MAVTVPLVWGMGIVFAKAAIAHFPPILLTALRFSLTAAVLVWFARIPHGNMIRLFAVAVVAAALQYSLTFTGLVGLEAGIASLILQLEVPFLVLLGALLLGEKPGFRKWMGILVAFCGIALMALNGGFGGSTVSALLVTSGALAWAFGQVMIRSLKDVDGLQVTAWVAVFAVPQLFVASFLFEDGQVDAVRHAGAIVWATVIYLGLVMTAFGYLLWNTLIRRHDVGRVAPFLLLLPVFTVIGGFVFLGEQPGIGKLAGGAVILLGVAIITIKPGFLAQRAA